VDYWELRKRVARMVPRMTKLIDKKMRAQAVQEKGRKKNYQQFNIPLGEWRKQERLLNTEEINSFLEISVRAAACPMPFNMDVWDGLLCPYNCLYCFPAGTKILMADGTEKVIERINQGDRVMSFNETSKELEVATVTKPMSRQTREELICIETEDGKILKMTPEHPVFTQRGWVDARDLKEEDEVLSWLTSMEPEYIRPWVSSFFQNPLKSVKIKKIWKEEGKTRKVYNMEVEPNNTYVANGIVVHNCYANAFRASLYTAFFDNSKTMGYRHCNAKFYKTEIDKMLKYRSLPMEEKRKLTGINKAFSLDIPVRLGIRFEDFLLDEKKESVALELLQYMANIGYPVMINTKSDLPGSDPYVEALSRNPARTAIHVTVITSDNKVLKRIEPGAPSYDDRLKAMKTLTQAGVRVVARIEPYLFLLTDNPEAVEKYQEDMLEAGVRHITFDTYSYTALNPGIRQSIQNAGYDFDRMFLAGADSQPLGSILLGSFMELFRKKGFSCSTFDMGNAPSNSQSICCEVGDWFKGGFNYGSTVMAARFIQSRKGKPTSWKDFEKYVEEKGGFLSEELKRSVHELWNLGGNVAYSHRWAAHMVPTGMDDKGLIWRYDENTPDYRKILEEELL